MAQGYTGPPPSWSDIFGLMRAEAERCRRVVVLLEPVEAELTARTHARWWSGGGAEAYDAVREKQLDQIRRTAEAHRAATHALHRYADAAEDLSRRFPEDTSGPSLAEMLTERGHQAADAARVLDEASAALEEMKATLGDLPALAPVALSSPDANLRLPETPALVLPTETSTRPSAWSVAQFPVPGGTNADLQALSDAVLRHFQALGGTIGARLAPEGS